MKILAFDSAGDACSGCLWEDGAVLASAALPMRHGQAEALMPMLADLMRQADWGWDGLDRLAVTTGPGSFTGVRVGLATARALALAASIPAIGVSTLEAFAFQALDLAETRFFLALVESRRDDVFFQLFERARGGRAVVPLDSPAAAETGALPARLADKGAVSSLALCGDAAGRVSPMPAGTSANVGRPWVSVEHVAALAAQRKPPFPPPAALYIRSPDATLPQHGGRLRP